MQSDRPQQSEAFRMLQLLQNGNPTVEDYQRLEKSLEQNRLNENIRSHELTVETIGELDRLHYIYLAPIVKMLMIKLSSAVSIVQGLRLNNDKFADLAQFLGSQYDQTLHQRNAIFIIFYLITKNQIDYTQNSKVINNLFRLINAYPDNFSLIRKCLIILSASLKLFPKLFQDFIQRWKSLDLLLRLFSNKIGLQIYSGFALNLLHAHLVILSDIQKKNRNSTITHKQHDIRAIFEEFYRFIPNLCQITREQSNQFICED